MRTLLEKLGDWPFFAREAWLEDDFEWTQCINKFQEELGFSHLSFFPNTTKVDSKNTTKPTLKDMVAIAVMFGAEKITAEKEIREYAEFEMELEEQTEFNEMEKIMNNTAKKIQANYLMWRAVQTLFAMSGLKINNIPATESSNDICLGAVLKYFKLAANSFYIRKYFTNDVRENATEIFKNVQQELKNILNSTAWISELTREKLLKKAESIKIAFGYPDNYLDDKYIEEYYEKLEISPKDYLGSVISLSLFNAEKEAISELRKPDDKTEKLFSIGDITDINAYYEYSSNGIKVTPGYLHEQYFSKDRPQYINYGYLGLVIGHEISHGFGRAGVRFDEHGIRHKWLDPESIENFRLKSECIKQQYSNYTVQEVEMNVNGTLTEKENVADNGGIKLTYLAYQEWVKRYGPEPKLPGIDYSPSQLFWISTAQKYCIKSGIEALNKTVRTKSHSPYEFRVMGMLSNMVEFSKDFNCPLGSKMNPAKKCFIW